MKRAALAALIPLMSTAQTIETIDGVRVLKLRDAARNMEVAIAEIGCMAYEFKVNGKNVFWTPFTSPGELKTKPQLAGNPVLAPWANRIEGDAYWVNGKKYVVNDALGNIRRDGNKNPIHGLLMFSDKWRISESGCEIDFSRYPDLMAQFPFAHVMSIQYRLRQGSLEVLTSLRNNSMDPMPAGIGYHPYFKIHDAPRDQWKVHLAAKDHMLLSKTLIPTGQVEPVKTADLSLAGTQLDDVYTSLIRGPDGQAHFSVAGVKEKITVSYGPKYPVAVVYAPQGRDFICFEPMSGPTNAFNLFHAGVWKDLAMIPPGGQWSESFTITPSGF